jgi:hypothetical protein
MPMQAASLEVLEKANLPAPQARAIVQAIEIEIAGAHTSLATKDDVHRLELKIEGLRSEIHTTASSSARQQYAALLGQMAVLLGLAYFFVTHLKH